MHIRMGFLSTCEEAQESAGLGSCPSSAHHVDSDPGEGTGSNLSSCLFANHVRGTRASVGKSILQFCNL